MGVAIIKGTRNYIGMNFSTACKLAWRTSQYNAQTGMVYKLAQGKKSHPALFCRALPSKVRGYFAGNLLPSLMATGIEGF